MARTRVVGYTPVDTPRFRPLRAVVAVIVLIAVASGAWVAGREGGRGGSGRPAVAAATAAPGPGPSVSVVADPMGYPATPEGAAEAFASYLRSTYALSMAPVEQGQAFLARVTAPGARSSVREALNTRTPWNGQEGFKINQFIPARLTSAAEADGTVRVAVWGVQVFALKTDGSSSRLPPVTSWSTTTARMVRHDGMWKVADVLGTVAGPTPTPYEQPDLAERFAEVLSVAGRPAGGA